MSVKSTRLVKERKTTEMAEKLFKAFSNASIRIFSSSSVNGYRLQGRLGHTVIV